MQKIKVVIAEDWPDWWKLLEICLKHKGLEMVRAGDGRQAMQMIEESSPDLLITDIGMPQMDGITLIREIRDREALTGTSKPLPIIAMSASPAEILSGAIKAGAAYAFGKTFDEIERLKTIIKGLFPKSAYALCCLAASICC